MFKKVSGLMIAAIVITACSDQMIAGHIEKTVDQNKIIGGKKVESGTMISRSTVALYDGKSQSLCTGTLVTKNLVLTAAHCVDPKDSSQLSVIFATDVDKSKKEQRLQALSVVAHDSYQPENEEDTYDLAMVRFDGELPEGFGPAPLLGNFDEIEEGTSIVVAGYGLSWAWGVKFGSGTLRSTSVVVKALHHGQTEIMLDQSFNNGVCSGDSGGPAYLEKNGRLYLVGVTSRVTSWRFPLFPKCATSSVFTRIDAHKLWIVQTAQELSLL